MTGLPEAFEQFKYAEAVLIANQAERFGLRIVQSRQSVYVLQKAVHGAFATAVSQPVAFLIDRLHPTRTTGFRSTGFVRQDRQITTNNHRPTYTPPPPTLRF